jgi:hypothetical protein
LATGPMSVVGGVRFDLVADDRADLVADVD